MLHPYTVYYVSEDGHQGIWRIHTSFIYDKTKYKFTEETIEKYRGYIGVHIIGFKAGIDGIDNILTKMSKEDRELWSK